MCVDETKYLTTRKCLNEHCPLSILLFCSSFHCFLYFPSYFPLFFPSEHSTTITHCLERFCSAGTKCPVCSHAIRTTPHAVSLPIACIIPSFKLSGTVGKSVSPVRLVYTVATVSFPFQLATLLILTSEAVMSI
jgi:hypothetical protein